MSMGTIGEASLPTQYRTIWKLRVCELHCILFCSRTEDNEAHLLHGLAEEFGIAGQLLDTFAT
jgi:hypothetical protein